MTLKEFITDIHISKDNELYCAMYGNNRQNGAIGYGVTLQAALIDLAEWIHIKQQINGNKNYV